MGRAEPEGLGKQTRPCLLFTFLERKRGGGGKGEKKMLLGHLLGAK